MLTNLTQNERLDLAWFKPIYLVQIELTAKILYISDQDFSYIYGSTIENYESYISNLADMQEQIGGLNFNTNTYLELKFINDAYAAHDHLIELHDVNSLLDRKISIYEIRQTESEETYTSDVKKLLWTGYTEKIRNITKQHFNIVCSSRLFHLRNSIEYQKLNLIDFANADPDDIGKTRNKIYGDVEHVPCLAIKAGAVDTLALSITSSATTIYISGASIIEFPSGAFTLQADAEKIRISSRSENTLIVSARGYDSTTAVSHDKGVDIAEVLTEYIYEAADHAVMAIGHVYVDNIRQVSGYTGYTGKTGDELAGYLGTAVIRFTAKATVEQQVNLDVDDNIAVSDTISISQGSHSHSGSAPGSTIIKYGLSTTPYAYGSDSISNKDNVIDGDANTYASMTIASGSTGVREVSLNISFNNNNYGTLSEQYVNIKIGSAYTNCEWNLVFNGHTFSLGSAAAQKRINVSAYASWSASPRIYYRRLSGSVGSSRNLYEVTMDYVYAQTTTIDPHAATGVGRSGSVTKTGGVSLSGNSSANTVIGRLVTANIEGFQDDGAGTYTGTPDALIERPDHIIKHLLGSVMGEAAGDIGGSFAASGTVYASAISGGYKMAFLANEISAKADLLLSILAHDCRSDFYDFEGKYELVFCPGTVSSADEILEDTVMIEPIYELSDIVELKNKLQGYYRRDYRKTGTSGTKYMDMVEKITGDADKPEEIELKSVRMSAMAEDVLDWIIDQKSSVKKSVTVTVGWEKTGVSPSSTFSIVGWLFASKIFKIQTYKINNKNRTIMLQGREV